MEAPQTDGSSDSRGAAILEKGKEGRIGMIEKGKGKQNAKKVHKKGRKKQAYRDKKSVS